MKIMGRLMILGILIFCGLAPDNILAQISQGGTPPSFDKAAMLKSSVDVNRAIMPALDIDRLLEEDEADRGAEVPFRFGYPFEVDYNLDNSGDWETLSDGSRLWRLRINAPGAYSINLIYDRWWLPKGAEFFVYSADKEMVRGAFTSFNNKDHGQFATAPVKGDAVILEYYEPAEVAGEGIISVATVVHAYRDVFNFSGKDTDDYGDAGSCNVNINCEEGYDWQAEKKSVAMILTSSGSRICTGALVNNVREDGTPYFLTAYHCLGGEETWIFMFNYESASCANSDGPTDMTVQGSTLRASYAISDFALLELDENPPETYGVYLSGWSAEEVASQSSTCIHHPSGDIKKISFDYDSVSEADYLEYTGTSHWRINSWDLGTTEGGSSGSPLFNQNHRIVGQLHGGYASCTSLTSDWFGKFARSWNGGGTSSTQLSYWLDPDDTGLLYFGGWDPYGGTQITHSSLSDTRDTLNDYAIICTISAQTDLEPSSLELHYNVGSGWIIELLTATGSPNEYEAAIPAQDPGTEVEYYLTAEDIEGTADTTITYSFDVLFSPLIVVSPLSMSHTITVGDSAKDSLYISNNGNGSLDYDIYISPVSGEKRAVLESLIAADALAPANQNNNLETSKSIPSKTATDTIVGAPQDKSAGGPDNYGYYWIDSDETNGPAYDWIDISATGTDVTPNLDDDNYVGPFAIGFDFPYYGDWYSEFYIGSNGIVGFDPNDLDSYREQALPDPDIPNALLAWLWDDLDITNSSNTDGRVYYFYDGSRLIIQFYNYPEYRAGAGEVINAQIILEKNGTIVYQYQSIATGFDILNCAVGMENADGTDALEVVYHSAYLHDELRIEFYMPFQWLQLNQISGSVASLETDTIEVSFSAVDMDLGTYEAELLISNNGTIETDNPYSVPVSLTVTDEIFYTCGDANSDDDVNIADVSHIVNYIFFEGPAPYPLERADANCDSDINLADAGYLINYIFFSGPEPCCP